MTGFRIGLGACAAVLLGPGQTALAATAGSTGFEPPVWLTIPFVLLLLSIAVLPLVASHFWHSHRNKGLVAAALAVPVALYLVIQGEATGHESIHALQHGMMEYVAFITLLASLYTVSGGIVLEGDLQATPATNTAFLAIGAVLANFIGTTGASMVLIRPVLRINQQRQHVRHLPVFFIFVVSNVGGLLTPLGDPPLFLGYLRGVDFFWTLLLWPQWLLINGLLLALFFVWDRLAYRREKAAALARDRAERQPLRMAGQINWLFLAGIVAAVLFLRSPWAEPAMAAMALLSLAVTPRQLRQANAFSWGPIIEVAVLFAGIFVVMVPALRWLELHGQDFGVSQPWQFFWLTGSLSAVLDNAPTYLTFAQLAAAPNDLRWLMENKPELLQAVSAGAVFMGALTYIGNGPNFMVKAIAEEAGYRVPSFFGYMIFSNLILVPCFMLVTAVFFRGG